MWTEINKNGTVSYRETYVDVLTSKTKKASVTYPKDTPSNRKKAAKELEKKIQELTNNISKDISLGDMSNLYIDYLKQNGKASSVKTIEYCFVGIFKVIDADIIVSNLTINQFDRMMASANLPSKTINRYIKVVKVMLKWAYQKDYHDNYRLLSKMTYVKDRMPKEQTEDKFYTREEITCILNHFESIERWDMWYATKFLYLTGMRIGELSALTVDDVTDVIDINKTFYHMTHSTDLPKSASSIRKIDISPELADVIKEYLLWRKETLVLGGKRTNLFMINERGNQFFEDTFLHQLKQIDIGKNITVHKFRHTHASFLAEEGFTLDEIAMRLGHHDSTITREVYVHVTEKRKAAMKDKIDRLKLLGN